MEQSDIDFYVHNGYLVHGPLLDEVTLNDLRLAYDDVIGEAQKKATGRALLATKKSGEVIPKEEQQVYQVMNACERNIHFRKLLFNPKMLEVVSTLMGPNIMLFHDQMLYKPPHTGGPVPWHQDNAYWKCRPANLVSCWLTLDDVTRENGAMQFIPGSHLVPVWHEDSAQKKDRDALLEIKGIDKSKAVVVDLPAGSCTFHHCQTLHYTEPNVTDRQRRAIAMHFMMPGTRNDSGNLGVVDWAHPMLQAAI